MLNVTKANEAWILHREDVEILTEGLCNLYVLLDAVSENCFGFETSVDLPNPEKIFDLIKQSIQKTGEKPEKIVIKNTDPMVEEVRKICFKMEIKFEHYPEKDLSPFTKEFRDSFRGYNRETPNQEVSDSELEEAQALMPETYGPCPCASGKKFKFCCQKAFKSIIWAMCEAQDGHLESALRYMKEAEEKVGRTAEVVCRLAVCWSFFDKEKSNAYLQETLSINPNHPRLNYLLGIECVEKKDYPRAVEFYQKAISQYPPEDKYHLNEAYNNLGTAFFEQKKFTEAKASWEMALVLMPKDKMVKNNLMNCIFFNPDVPLEIRDFTAFREKFKDFF